MRDFSHIAMIAGDSFMLAASRALGVKTFGDLVSIARDKPMACGSPGAGSQGHLLQVLINRAVNIRLQPVPYRSAADNMTDLLGNHISLALQPALSSNGLSTIDVDVAGLNEVVAKEVMLWGALAKDVGLRVQ